MNSWESASWLIVTGLAGLAGGRLWARLRSSRARRGRSGQLAALRSELDKQKLQAGKLEADLHAQRARSFALERELEARESDWAQSSPTPFAFDAHTFQIDRSPSGVERVADLEQQVRDLQDLLAKVSARPRSSRASSSQRARHATDPRRPITPAWVELDAANSAHGTLAAQPETPEAPPPTAAVEIEIEGLARRIEALQNNRPPSAAP